MTSAQMIVVLIGITLLTTIFTMTLSRVVGKKGDIDNINQIYVVVKSEKIGTAFPVWEFVSYYDNESTARMNARRLQESNDLSESRRGFIKYKVVPLAVKSGPFVVNGDLLLKKEYNRRCAMVKTNLTASYIL